MSMDFSECTRTALPGNGPGIPGFGEGAKWLTTRYLGMSVGSGCAGAGHGGELQKIATVHSDKIAQLL